MTIRIATISMIVLAFGASLAPGQEGGINSKSELRRALLEAKTPEDHARIAYYYHRVAGNYTQAQAEEDKIAAQWQTQYENWTKSPNPLRSAKNLSAYYGQLASDASRHANEQDKLAMTQTASKR
jgi:hypothetical protein